MNLYLHDQLVAMHRQDLQHEAEQSRLLAQLSPRQGYAIRHVISRMGTLMIALGTRLQSLDQRYEQVAYADQYV
jgi:hypothetical protein